MSFPSILPYREYLAPVQARIIELAHMLKFRVEINHTDTLNTQGESVFKFSREIEITKWVSHSSIAVSSKHTETYTTTRIITGSEVIQKKDTDYLLTLHILWMQEIMGDLIRYVGEQW